MAGDFFIEHREDDHEQREVRPPIRVQTGFDNHYKIAARDQLRVPKIWHT